MSSNNVGFLWYGPYLFGPMWTKAMKEDENPKFNPNAPSRGPNPVVGAAVVWLTTSLVFSGLVSMTGSEELPDLLKLAGISWLGFSVPGHVFSVLFEDHSKTVNVLGAAYMLTVLTLMAVCHWLL